jgi:hypothetical protein
VTEAEPDGRGLMTRREVADYLRCSLSSVDRLRLGGSLGPPARVGTRSIRLYRVCVLAYVESNTPPYGTPEAPR